jgi:hypothetical protein
MSGLFWYHVFFGLLAATGVGLLISAFGGWMQAAGRWWRSRARSQRNPLDPGWRASDDPSDAVISDLPPFAQRLFGQPLADLSWLLFREQDHASVEARLRRTGWRYRSVGDYYGSKVASAILYCVLGAMSCAALGLPALVICLAAAGLGALGLYRPDEKVNESLRERRDALFREMAWTLDRIALTLRTGTALQPALSAMTAQERLAWVGKGSGGLFIAVIRDLSGGLVAGQTEIGALIEEVRSRLPDGLPELDEFLEMVRASQEQKGTGSAGEQLQLLARGMRDRLNNRIEELAQRSELKVVLLTSGVIVPTLLFVIGGAALLRVQQLF